MLRKKKVLQKPEMDEKSLRNWGDERNYARSERPFKHAGVANHPGDNGMAAIADALLDALGNPQNAIDRKRFVRDRLASKKAADDRLSLVARLKKRPE